MEGNREAEKWTGGKGKGEKKRSEVNGRRGQRNIGRKEMGREGRTGEGGGWEAIRTGREGGGKGSSYTAKKSDRKRKFGKC